MPQGRYRAASPARPDDKHHEGFDKALREALKQLPPSGEKTYKVEFSVNVEHRPNPGWVIEYVVDLT